MKKSLVILAILGLAVAGFAQEKKHEIVVGGGIGTPVSPNEFTDGFKLGFDGRIGAGYFVTPKLLLGANIGFNSFALDKDFVRETGEVPAGTNVTIKGGNLRVIELAALAKYYTMPRTKTTNIYLLGGPGVGFTRLSDLSVTIPGVPTSVEVEGENETRFVFTAGAGITHRIHPTINLFVEGRYSRIFADEDASYVPVRIGVMF